MDVLDLPHDTFVKAYNKPLESSYYNKFFNPNICHVCKKRLASELKLCKCGMIAYCGDDHKEMHYKDHRELCEAIFNVYGPEILWTGNRCYNMSEWADTKKKLAGKVREELKRKLEPYEEQMFLFVRSCFICHAAPERKDNFCKICHCINYCNAHKSVLGVHKFFCSQLQLSLSLELDNIELEIPEIINILEKFPDSNRHLCDMFEFIKQYVLEPEQETWSTREFIFTDYVTNPLTVFYGITEMQVISRSPEKINNFIIHIILGEYIDTLNLFVWEFLLHLLKYPTRLIIIVIGQQYDKNLENYEYSRLCGMCNKRSSKLLLEFYPEPYHNYVIKHPCYKKPNVIVGFDLKLNESWSEILKAIQAQGCPLLLTAKTLVQAQENINTISKCLGDVVKVFYNISNKFCGCIPHRDPDTENVYFLNKRLTLYWNLGQCSTS